MATYKAISGTVPQYSTEDNELAYGYYLKFYDANTTTPRSMATDDSGGTLLAKCKLNTRGMPISNENDDNSVFIPHMDADYRIVLYKTEADADADNTTNAEFNIPDTAPEIAPSADAADITLRTNNLEAWDDYDRSPLFVDGTDFTAGAGPHTITVPAGWDPTDSDMRFWRLDVPSDTVEALTPTATSSNDFTLAETLLSTDVIFIGDDQFRNIHDGDPDDIRSRLSVESQTEAEAKYLEEANNLSDLTDPSAARSNLGLVDYETTTKSLDNDFTSGSMVATRFGNLVVISISGANYTGSLTSAATSSGFVPASMVPSLAAEIYNMSRTASSGFMEIIRINNSGVLTVDHRDYTGALVNRSFANSLSIAYTI